MLSPFAMEIYGAIVRWLLASLGGALVAHHILTNGQADALTAHLLNHAILAAPVVASLALSIWQKVRSKHALALAYETPAPSPKVGVSCRF